MTERLAGGNPVGKQLSLNSDTEILAPRVHMLFLYRRYTPLDLISNIDGHVLIYKIVESDFYFHIKYKRVAKWILRVTEMY